MTNVVDWILDLFRDPVQAQAFINDPNRSMLNAGVQNVTAAQVQAVAATVAPAAVIHGGGDPVYGLQQAVAETHGIAFTPQYEPTFAPDTQAFSNNDTLSHNDVLSNNDPHILSPEAGHDVQQGGVNLDFGDITFGDKNTASDGSVINTGNAGDIDTTNVEGDGNVVGDDNNANTGVIEAGDHSPVIVGEGNDTEVSDSSQHSGGDIITGNEGNIIKDNDMSGGHGGSASSSGGGGLLGIGNDSEANAGGGGGGGSIILTDASSHDSSTTVGGDQTTVNAGHDVSGGVDASHDDNSVDNSDNSTHDSHDATVETHVDVSNDVGLF